MLVVCVTVCVCVCVCVSLMRRRMTDDRGAIIKVQLIVWYFGKYTHTYETVDIKDMKLLLAASYLYL